MKKIIENPFDLTKANHFSDNQIYDYWVNMETGDNNGLLEFINPTSLMPMMVLGSKGCGKTHLMRYCSEPVQLMRNENNIISTIKREGYLGIYVYADALNTGRFFGKGQDDETWYQVFSYYFEIWMVLCLLEIIKKIINAIDKSMENNIVESILKLININLTNIDNIDNLDKLIEYFEETRKKIDNSVNNCAITRKIDGLNIIFNPGDLLYGIPKILNESIDILSNTIFLYLIDEIENFDENQQIFINTLIRYRRGNVSIKIGARLYGIKTYKTHPSGEEIRERAEFEIAEFDKFLNDKNYFDFIKNLIIKRLNKLNIKTFVTDFSDLYKYFQEIETEDYYKDETLKIISTREKERIYFKKLKDNLKKYTKEKRINDIVSNLSLTEYPLLEKLNIFILYKSINKDVDLLELSESIGIDAKSLISNVKNDSSKKYQQVYQHFNNDMLAQLYREYKRNIPYSGLETIIHLSQGAPRNALSLLKNIYKRAIFNGEEPFLNNKISIKSQTEGIADTAEWFWDDVHFDNNGIRIRIAIENLSILYRYIRFCLKPTECDLSSFSIDINILSEEARTIIKNAENWSYLIHQSKGRSSKNTQQINDSFQLAPMLAPKWGLSQRRGGTIEIKKDLANAIFSDNRELFKKELRKRLKSISFEFNDKKTDKTNDDDEDLYNGGLFP
jgi:hypothetical protein